MPDDAKLRTQQLQAAKYRKYRSRPFSGGFMLTDEMRKWLAEAQPYSIWDGLYDFRQEFNLSRGELALIIAMWIVEGL